MKNEFAEKIKDEVLSMFLIERDYAGCADGDNQAWINGEDRNGNDIKVTIEVMPAKEPDGQEER